MSRKVLNKKVLFDSEPMGPSLSSEPIPTLFEDNLGIQFHWTGTGTGVFSVQVTNDDPNSPTEEATWDDLTFNPVLAQPAGSAGGYAIDLNQLPFPYLRLHWEPTDAPGQAAVTIQDIDYLAQTGGVAGNSITITYVSGGIKGSEVVDVVGNAITVHIQTGGGGSNANDVVAAVTGNAAAFALVDAAVSGTPSTVQTVQGPTNLTGGTEEDGTLNASISGRSLS